MSSLNASTGSSRRSVLMRTALLFGLAMILVSTLIHPAAAADSRVVVVGKIDDAITPVMARYVARTIDRAEKQDAAAVVFEMDTPGGLSSAMDDIVRSILESDVPVVVYVTPRSARAASAGVYIAYAAHVSAMAPGTNIGSASPIFIGADGSASDGSETLKKKVTNDAVAQITNLAQLRGRNVDWAVKAVRDADNITADQALQLGVIDLMADNLDDLLTRIDGRTVQMANGTMTLATAGATTESAGMTVMDRLFQLLSDPTIAYLLVSLGLLGIFVELSHPGITLPGVLGGLALLIGLFSLGTLPVSWAGVALLIFAFVLFIADLFVPSFGTLTIGGLASFVAGSFLLLSDNAPPGYELSRPAIWTMTTCLLGFSLLLGYLVMRARRQPPSTGRQSLVGMAGETRTALDPEGMVYVNGELWRAAVSAGEIASGEAVVVTAVAGLTLTVHLATAAEIVAPSAARPIQGSIVATTP